LLSKTLRIQCVALSRSSEFDSARAMAKIRCILKMDSERVEKKETFISMH